MDTNPWGDHYIFLGLESDTKLLMMPTIGKRSRRHTCEFMEDLRAGVLERFQLTTDGFPAYRMAVWESFRENIDFAQLYKERYMFNSKKKVIGRHKRTFAPRAGSPDRSRITTAHVERVNLSLRTFNRRFTRSTICYSKDEKYLAYSVYLFVAHYNFCREHSALEKKVTPAMQAGLTDRRWSLENILSGEIGL